MASTLFWLQCGGCGGDTWSLFNETSPSVADLFNLLGIELLWHPSISNEGVGDQKQLIDDLVSGNRQLDILCVEGSVLRGPKGTGLYDMADGGPKRISWHPWPNAQKISWPSAPAPALAGLGPEARSRRPGFNSSNGSSAGFWARNSKHSAGCR